MKLSLPALDLSFMGDLLSPLRTWRRKWRLLAAMVGLLAIFVLNSANVIAIPGLGRLEQQLYDQRVRQTMVKGVDDRIVILDIDEKSLAEFGQWPWNRTRIATIVDTLFDKYGVAVLGFDVVWAESETEQLRSILTDTGAASMAGPIWDRLDTDRAFGDRMQNRPIVLGYYFNNEKGAVTKNALPAPVLTKDQIPKNQTIASTWTGYTGNLPVLLQGTTIAGQINSVTDDDGIIRRVPLLIPYRDGYYESLSTAMIRTLFGGQPITPVIGEADGYQRVEALQVGPLTLPVDRELAALVTYRGPSRSFTYISLGDVLAGRVPADKLAGRIVLIGTSAPGLSDIRATPTDEIMPGVEIHANLIASAMDQTVRQQPAYAQGIDIIQLVALGLVAILLLPLLGATGGIIVYLALTGAAVWFNMIMWKDALFVIPLASAIILLASMLVFNLGWGFLIEGRAKRQLGDMFGQYVPPDLVKEMARDPGNYSMESRDADLTVMFSDLRGFTTISEKLTAKELAAYINEYLTRMSKVISDRKGTLDKFIGDAIMAFWGAPVPDAFAAANAVDSAIAMQVEAAQLSREFVAKGWPEFHIGIGINTGPMRVGDMGSKLRRAYTVMGDPVNLGSRLEGLTKNYGVEIIVGEGTVAVLPDYSFRLLDRVRVKGKDEAVQIYEPMGKVTGLTPDQVAELGQWEAVMDAYFVQDWDQARSLVNHCRSSGAPSGLCDLYDERIDALEQDPPGPGWDGVTKFTTK